ncbi:phage/plasmid primase, P4 family [Bacillus cereus]|uniref:DNA primase n=2 Tax=Bacillus cereus group TaxID=86661 RepID=A0A9W3PDP5_BACTU|nr:phage/plasmid primase, P4 family [Bacillus thuringiensis]AHA69489.1 putative DNA primase [Bacillus thuringiensis YBT-1518]MBG9482760.1 DNA primase [Bacillus thuringiensis]MBG9500382.1 DNA primase [Bacillus thuringiensis]
MQAVSIKEYQSFPVELTTRTQWVLWKLEPIIDKKTGEYKVNKENGQFKYTKVPYQINGLKADSTIPSTWASYDETVKAYKSTSKYNGIGYVLSEDDPYTAIDLDDHIKDGEIQPEAQSIVNAMDSYTEYSQSGTGLHIFIKAKKSGKRSKNSTKGIEIYDSERFIVMTGDHVDGTPTEIHERQDILSYIYDSYFPASKKTQEIKPSKLDLSPKLSDEDVLNIGFKAKNGQKFKGLYSGNWSNYGSQSEADQALCNLIAFYTQDPEQIDRIFTGSGLYRDDKWERQDYKDGTIQHALDGLKATYQQRTPNESFHLYIKDSPTIDLKKELRDRYFRELAEMEAEWEANGGKGRKPTTISPIRCAEILPEYISFILFDYEENTRLAMYQPIEGTYTRNVTLIKRVISWLEPKLNNSKAEDVIYHLTNKADMKEKTESRYLIPVKNGVFNLKTKTLESFTADYVFTTKITTPYIENPVNPVLDDWDVVSWIQSIACGDVEIEKLLWQVLNDALNGNYSRRKSIFLIGEGNNGKGTFQELIMNLIGMKNIATLKVNEFDERFRLSVLEGKTAVIGDDVPANVYIDDSSNFNSVVTGDMVSVEFKNKPIYNTVFRCSVIQSTNGMPKFKNKTNGTIRRIVIVPFQADFNGKTENFKIKDEYIKDERVLQFVLYRAINMDFETFDIPKVSLQELEVFKQDNDPVLDFKLSIFDEWGIQEVPKYIVYGFYKKFCMDNGYKYLADRQFYKQFRRYLGEEWEDSQNRFRYDSLIKYVGDLDKMNLGFGFPDQSKPCKTYKKNTFKVV